jgi:hypothetical protein
MKDSATKSATSQIFKPLQASRRKKRHNDNEIFAAKRQRRKRKANRTKARMWLPSTVIFPSRPHTCFFLALGGSSIIW